MSDRLIDELKKVSGVRTFTDEEGKFHLTTKSLEKEEEEKFGKKCDNCHKRSKFLRTTLDNQNICESCHRKIWEEKEIIGVIETINVICPFCSKNLSVTTSGGGNCGCGAIYRGGFDYDSCGEYGYTFYKRKNV